MKIQIHHSKLSIKKKKKCFPNCFAHNPLLHLEVKNKAVELLSRLVMPILINLLATVYILSIFFLGKYISSLPKRKFV